MKLKTSLTVLSLLASFNIMAKYRKITPNFDIKLDRIGKINDGILSINRDTKIKQSNSFFSTAIDEAILKTARDKAIKYLEENQEERNHKFKSEAAFLDFKQIFLSGQYSNTTKIDTKNGPRTLSSIYASVEDLGFSLVEQDKFESRLKSYSNMYELLPEDIKIQLVIPKYIIDIGGLEYNFTILYGLLNNIRDIPLVLIDLYPAEYKLNCEDEIGYKAPMSPASSNNVADNSARCSASDYHSDGLYKNSDYALKYNTTCMKDQGNRGTCVAFVINAAIETQGYVKDGKAFNLSEQFTYFNGEIMGGSSNGKNGRYDYGLNTNKTLKVLDKENASLQLETRWAYNPSWSMANNINSNDKWSNSCDAYNGEKCTNRAFQATESKESCGWFCTNWVYTVPSMSSSYDFEVTDYDNFWSSWNKDGSLDQAISYVNAGKPVIAGFTVRNYMWQKASSSGDGYIRYQDHNDSNEGGHAFLIIGFVKNADLPDGVTNAREEGYFIVKNSWGITAGDCGYLYIDYKYMRKEATSLHTISSKRP